MRETPLPLARDFVGGGVRLWLNLEPTVATLDFVVIIDLLLVDLIVLVELFEVLVVVEAAVVHERAWDASEVKLSWLAEGIIAVSRWKFTSAPMVDLFWLATLPWEDRFTDVGLRLCCWELSMVEPWLTLCVAASSRSAMQGGSAATWSTVLQDADRLRSDFALLWPEGTNADASAAPAAAASAAAVSVRGTDALARI